MAPTVMGAALLSFCLLSAGAPLEHTRVGRPLCIVLGPAGPLTEQLQPALTMRYPGAVAVKSASMCPNGTQLALSVGPAALREMAAVPGDLPTISLFVTRQEFRKLVGSRTDFTAIYAEVDPSIQLRLVKELYQRPVRVSVLLGAETEDLRNVFTSAGSQAGLKTQIIEPAPSVDPGRTVASTGSFDALVLVPDPSVLSAVTFRTILEATYRRGEGVIGFSAGQVSAGTLAAPFASLADILAQLDEMVATFRATGELATASYPHYWSVQINESVAHSLNLVVTDAARQLASRPASALAPLSMPRSNSEARSP